MGLVVIYGPVNLTQFTMEYLPPQTIKLQEHIDMLVQIASVVFSLIRIWGRGVGGTRSMVMRLRDCQTGKIGRTATNTPRARVTPVFLKVMKWRKFYQIFNVARKSCNTPCA